MSPLVLLATLALLGGAATLATSRQPRWFLRLGTVTRMVTESVVVTQVTPSSCVEVATSLSPCMDLTQEIAPSTSTSSAPSIDVTRNLEGGRAFWDGWLASSKNQPDDALVAPTPLVAAVDVSAGDAGAGGWRINHLFDGLYSTVTQTLFEEATARIDDIEHVITFSVVGCLPTQLPLNLPLCHSGDGVGVGVKVGPDPRSVA